MKKSIGFFLFSTFLLWPISFSYCQPGKNSEGLIGQCEKLAKNWIHEEGLDEADVEGYEVHQALGSAKEVDLNKDGNEEVFISILLTTLPSPGESGGPGDGRNSGLLYFFLPIRNGQPVTIQKIFEAGIWDENITENRVLEFGKREPNLMVIFDGTSDGQGGEETGNVKAHVFRVEGTKVQEVLAYNSFGFVRQAFAPMYTSRISSGKGRDIVVNYSIPVRSHENFEKITSEKKVKITYEWDEKKGVYRLSEKSPTHFESYFNGDNPGFLVDTVVPITK